MSPNAALDRVFEPFARCLSPEVARKIVDFRANPDLAARVQVLADKASNGELTENERGEYQSYIRASDMIALLQSKSRQILRNHSKSGK